jgi:hypothetical protein
LYASEWVFYLEISNVIKYNKWLTLLIRKYEIRSIYYR